MTARDLAPGPWRVGDHGMIEDTNGDEVIYFSARFVGDESWREIAAELAAAREMREALQRLADSAALLMQELSDPGSEALAAYHCARAALAKAGGERSAMSAARTGRRRAHRVEGRHGKP